MIEIPEHKDKSYEIKMLRETNKSLQRSNIELKKSNKELRAENNTLAKRVVEAS